MNLFKKNKINVIITNNSDNHNDIISELKKISVNDPKILNVIPGTNTSDLLVELNNIINFLTKNNVLPNSAITINDFFEFANCDIMMNRQQLSSYVNNIRAMIYCYDNFENNCNYTHTHTMIIGGNIKIKQSNFIKENIFANNPDIVFFDKINSFHCYIIKNESFEKIFKALYPIKNWTNEIVFTDSHNIKQHNVTNCIIESNKKNCGLGLYFVYCSPSCDNIRNQIDVMKKTLLTYVNMSLPNNIKNNQNLSMILLFDTVYHQFVYVGHYKCNKVKKETYEPMIINDHSQRIINCNILTQCLNSIKLFLDMMGKNQGLETCSNIILSNIIDIIDNFIYHDKQITIKNIIYVPMAIAYGSTCFVYKLNDSVIMKKYCNSLRWKHKDHDDIKKIFYKELKYLKILNKSKHFTNLIDYDEENYMLLLTFEGESLFDNFLLPKNWKDQIISIFDELKQHNITYTEFNIKNIVVKNDVIKFIDFGLMKDESSNDNCYSDMFIGILETLNNRLSKETNQENKILLYNMFISNAKINGKFIDCIY